MTEPTIRESYLVALQELEAQQATAIVALDAVLQSESTTTLTTSLEAAIAQSVPSGEVENVIQNTLSCVNNLAAYIASKVAAMPAVESP